MRTRPAAGAASAAGLVLFTLPTGQCRMALNSSVMNVSIVQLERGPTRLIASHTLNRAHDA